MEMKWKHCKLQHCVNNVTSVTQFTRVNLHIAEVCGRNWIQCWFECRTWQPVLHHPPSLSLSPWKKKTFHRKERDNLIANNTAQETSISKTALCPFVWHTEYFVCVVPTRHVYDSALRRIHSLLSLFYFSSSMVNIISSYCSFGLSGQLFLC